jgi:hypothetical protein
MNNAAVAFDKWVYCLIHSPYVNSFFTGSLAILTSLLSSLNLSGKISPNLRRWVQMPSSKWLSNSLFTSEFHSGIMWTYLMHPFLEFTVTPLRLMRVAPYAVSAMDALTLFDLAPLLRTCTVRAWLLTAVAQRQKRLRGSERLSSLIASTLMM